jgi:uncharacterized protein
LASQASIIARLMRRALPDRIVPSRQAAAGGTVQAAVTLAQLPRLQGLLAQGNDPKTELQVELEVRLDAQKRAVLSGRVSGRLTLQCQRCLGPMPWDVALQLEMVVLGNEAEAGLLEDDADFLLATDDGFSPRQVVEDEIILALPLIPRHENEVECGALIHERPETAGAAPEEKRPSPFADLKRLKR